MFVARFYSHCWRVIVTRRYMKSASNHYSRPFCAEWKEFHFYLSLSTYYFGKLRFANEFSTRWLFNLFCLNFTLIGPKWFTLKYVRNAMAGKKNHLPTEHNILIRRTVYYVIISFYDLFYECLSQQWKAQHRTQTP